MDSGGRVDETFSNLAVRPDFCKIAVFALQYLLGPRVVMRRTSRCRTRAEAAPAKSIILNAKSLVFDTQFLVFDTRFLVFDAKFLVFDAKFIMFSHLS